ncbi:hypothetical protein ACFLTR_03690 [Chloroflexota bacterium]
MIGQNSAGSSLLRIGGAFTTAFSLAVGLLVLFVIPGACTFVSGLHLIFLGFLFIIGVFAFFLGNVLSRKKTG